MLADAIKSLRSEKHLDHEEKATDININIPVLIPEELIGDVNLRLIFIEESQMLKTRKSWTKFLMNWWIALDIYQLQLKIYWK